MPFFQSIPNTLQDLGTALGSIANSSDIYFYKNSSGAIQAYNNEHPLTTSNFGYPFQFIDGTISYTAITITNLNQIPWLYPYTTLTASNANLWNSSLMIWIDGLEPKSMSNSLQKVVSKDYTNNVIIVENTSAYSFSYASPNLSLTSSSSLETNAVQTVYAYFKLGMVFTLGTQTLNTVLFQHNRLKIKLSSQTAPDATTQSMICIFDNDVFKRGIKLKPSDLTFKYQLYTDNTGTLIVSSNTSVLSAAPSYYQATSAKMYVGSDSTQNYPANMVLHELLLYESTANDIVATSSNISTYFTSRHSLTTYTDGTNVLPYTDPYEAYLASGSLRLYVGTSGNTNGTTWLTFGDVCPNNAAKFTGTMTVVSNYAGCTKCISMVSAQTCTATTGYAAMGAHTITMLIRFSVLDSMGIIRLGTNPYMYIDLLATSGHIRVWTPDSKYNDWSCSLATGTWYVLTCTYSGSGALSTFVIRINGVAKSSLGGSGGTPAATALGDAMLLAPNSSITVYHAGLYINNTALTTGQIEKVEGYLVHSQFADGHTLDATHPYYSSAPTF